MQHHLIFSKNQGLFKVINTNISDLWRSHMKKLSFVDSKKFNKQSLNFFFLKKRKQKFAWLIIQNTIKEKKLISNNSNRNKSLKRFYFKSFLDSFFYDGFFKSYQAKSKQNLNGLLTLLTVTSPTGNSSGFLNPYSNLKTLVGDVFLVPSGKEPFSQKDNNKLKFIQSFLTQYFSLVQTLYSTNQSSLKIKKTNLLSSLHFLALRSGTESLPSLPYGREGLLQEEGGLLQEEGPPFRTVGKKTLKRREQPALLLEKKETLSIFLPYGPERRPLPCVATVGKKNAGLRRASSLNWSTVGKKIFFKKDPKNRTEGALKKKKSDYFSFFQHNLFMALTRSFWEPKKCKPYLKIKKTLPLRSNRTGSEGLLLEQILYKNLLCRRHSCFPKKALALKETFFFFFQPKKVRVEIKDQLKGLNPYSYLLKKAPMGPFRKTFFCYWLLPFVGLLSLIPYSKEKLIFNDNAYSSTLSYSAIFAKNDGREGLSPKSEGANKSNYSKEQFSKMEPLPNVKQLFKPFLKEFILNTTNNISKKNILKQVCLFNSELAAAEPLADSFFRLWAKKNYQTVFLWTFFNKNWIKDLDLFLDQKGWPKEVAKNSAHLIEANKQEDNGINKNLDKNKDLQSIPLMKSRNRFIEYKYYYGMSESNPFLEGLRNNTFLKPFKKKNIGCFNSYPILKKSSQKPHGTSKSLTDLPKKIIPIMKNDNLLVFFKAYKTQRRFELQKLPTLSYHKAFVLLEKVMIPKIKFLKKNQLLKKDKFNFSLNPALEKNYDLLHKGNDSFFWPISEGQKNQQNPFFFSFNSISPVIRRCYAAKNEKEKIKSTLKKACFFGKRLTPLAKLHLLVRGKSKVTKKELEKKLKKLKNFFLNSKSIWEFKNPFVNSKKIGIPDGLKKSFSKKTSSLEGLSCSLKKITLFTLLDSFNFKKQSFLEKQKNSFSMNLSIPSQRLLETTLTPWDPLQFKTTNFSSSLRLKTFYGNAIRTEKEGSSFSVPHSFRSILAKKKGPYGRETPSDAAYQEEALLLREGGKKKSSFKKGGLLRNPFFLFFERKNSAFLLGKKTLKRREQPPLRSSREGSTPRIEPKGKENALLNQLRLKNFIKMEHFNLIMKKSNKKVLQSLLNELLIFKTLISSFSFRSSDSFRWSFNFHWSSLANQQNKHESLSIKHVLDEIYTCSKQITKKTKSRKKKFCLSFNFIKDPLWTEGDTGNSKLKLVMNCSLKKKKLIQRKLSLVLQKNYIAWLKKEYAYSINKTNLKPKTFNKDKSSFSSYPLAFAKSKLKLELKRDIVETKANVKAAAERYRIPKIIKQHLPIIQSQPYSISSEGVYRTNLETKNNSNNANIFKSEFKIKRQLEDFLFTNKGNYNLLFTGTKKDFIKHFKKKDFLRKQNKKSNFLTKKIHLKQENQSSPPSLRSRRASSCTPGKGPKEGSLLGFACKDKKNFFKKTPADTKARWERVFLTKDQKKHIFFSLPASKSEEEGFFKEAVGFFFATQEKLISRKKTNSSVLSLHFLPLKKKKALLFNQERVLKTKNGFNNQKILYKKLKSLKETKLKKIHKNSNQKGAFVGLEKKINPFFLYPYITKEGRIDKLFRALLSQSLNNTFIGTHVRTKINHDKNINHDKAFFNLNFKKEITNRLNMKYNFFMQSMNLKRISSSFGFQNLKEITKLNSLPLFSFTASSDSKKLHPSGLINRIFIINKHLKTLKVLRTKSQKMPMAYKEANFVLKNRFSISPISLFSSISSFNLLWLPSLRCAPKGRASSCSWDPGSHRWQRVLKENPTSFPKKTSHSWKKSLQHPTVKFNTLFLKQKFNRFFRKWESYNKKLNVFIQKNEFLNNKSLSLRVYRSWLLKKQEEGTAISDKSQSLLEMEGLDPSLRISNIPVSFEIKNKNFLYSFKFLQDKKRTNLGMERLNLSDAAKSFIKSQIQYKKNSTLLNSIFLFKNQNLLEAKEKVKKNRLLILLQKKRNLWLRHRALKQRRETGRLLKRKRFYPRPIWLRLIMYQKFLKLRHRKFIVPKSSQAKITNLKLWQNPKRKQSLKHFLSSFKRISSFSNQREANIRNPIFPSITYTQTNPIKWSSGLAFSKKDYKNKIKNLKMSLYYSIQKNPVLDSKRNYSFFYNPLGRIMRPYNLKEELFSFNTNLISLSYPSFKENNFLFSIGEVPLSIEKHAINAKYSNTPIFNVCKAYIVSKNVLTDLKKGLGNNNWGLPAKLARANLNAYLRKIKQNLNRIKKITQTTELESFLPKPILPSNAKQFLEAKFNWYFKPLAYSLLKNKNSFFSNLPLIKYNDFQGHFFKEAFFGATLPSKSEELPFLKNPLEEGRALLLEEAPFFKSVPTVATQGRASSCSWDPGRASKQNLVSLGLLDTSFINPVPTLSENLVKWEIALKKAATQEISYQRCEQIISNIKYNLSGFSLAGEASPQKTVNNSFFQNQKKRSSSDFERRPSSFNAFGIIPKNDAEIGSGNLKEWHKQNKRQIWNSACKKTKKPILKDFSLLTYAAALLQNSSGTLKKLSFDYPFCSQNLGNISKQKIYWAINKTNIWLYKNRNKKKYLWANQKQREQNRSNKTKNLINKIVTLALKPIQEKYNFKTNKTLKIFLNSNETKNYGVSLLGEGAFVQNQKKTVSSDFGKKIQAINEVKESIFSASPLTPSVPDRREGTLPFKKSFFKEEPEGLKDSWLNNFNNNKNYNLFLTKQKQKEKKLNYLGFLDSNYTKIDNSTYGALFLFSHNYKNVLDLHFPSNYFLLKHNFMLKNHLREGKNWQGGSLQTTIPLKKATEKLINNKIVWQKNHLALAILKNKLKIIAPNDSNKTSAFVNNSWFIKNGILKEHKVFLRHLKNSLRINSPFWKIKKETLTNKCFAFPNFSKRKQKYYYSYTNLLQEQKKANSFLMGKSYMRVARANALNIEKRLNAPLGPIELWPFNKNVSNSIFNPSTATSQEIQKKSHLNLFNPYNLNINMKKSTTTFIYLIFLISTMIFHLCSLFSLISSAEIRSVIKFVILFSLKVTYLYIGIIRFIFLSFLKIKTPYRAPFPARREGGLLRNPFFLFFERSAFWLGKKTLPEGREQPPYREGSTYPARRVLLGARKKAFLKSELKENSLSSKNNFNLSKSPWLLGGTIIPNSLDYHQNPSFVFLVPSGKERSQSPEPQKDKAGLGSWQKSRKLLKVYPPFNQTSIKNLTNAEFFLDGEVSPSKKFLSDFFKRLCRLEYLKKKGSFLIRDVKKSDQFGSLTPKSKKDLKLPLLSNPTSNLKLHYFIQSKSLRFLKTFLKKLNMNINSFHLSSFNKIRKGLNCYAKGHLIPLNNTTSNFSFFKKGALINFFSNSAKNGFFKKKVRSFFQKETVGYPTALRSLPYGQSGMLRSEGFFKRRGLLLSRQKKLLFKSDLPFPCVATVGKGGLLRNPREGGLHFLGITKIQNPLNKTFIKFFKADYLLKAKIALFSGRVIKSLLKNIFFKVGLNVSYSCYNFLLKSLEIPKTGIQSVYIFLEKPGELLSDWITHLFLIEIASDLTTTIPETTDSAIWNSLTKFAKSSSFMALPLLKPILGSFAEKRLFSCFEIILQILSQPDIDLIVRQKKISYAWDIWGEMLKNVAEKNNINLSLLTNKKEDQAFLISKVLEDNAISDTLKLNYSRTLASVRFNLHSNFSINWRAKNTEKKLNVAETKNNLIWQRWAANQFLTYKGKDSDLFIQAPPAPKSFQVNFQTIKHYNPIQAPIGKIICQIYSDLFSKKTAKNFLIVGIASRVNYTNQKNSGQTVNDERSLLIQSLAGETEMKIIRDNANRYNFSLGIKSLRNVFDALALHTPCIFLIEDIHIIGERRPLLVGDYPTGTKAVQNSSGTEPNQPNDEKNLSIAKLTRHVIMHYKKPFRGDYSYLIPTNNYSFDLFLGGNSPPFGKTRQFGLTPSSPIILEKENTTQKKSPVIFKASNLQKTNSLDTNLFGKKKEKMLVPPSTTPLSLLHLKEPTQLKPQNTVKEIPWIGLSEQSTLSSELPKQIYSIRVKIALLAHLAVSNLSVKLNMITDLLVIIDSVRANRGFVVFATTHTPSILDPALRRPGRLDETIALPFISKLENRWEIIKSNMIGFKLVFSPSFFSFYSNKYLFKGITESGFPHGLTVDLLDYGLSNYSFSTQNLQTIPRKIKEKLLRNNNSNFFAEAKAKTKTPFLKAGLIKRTFYKKEEIKQIKLFYSWDKFCGQLSFWSRGSLPKGIKKTGLNQKALTKLEAGAAPFFLGFFFATHPTVKKKALPSFETLACAATVRKQGGASLTLRRRALLRNFFKIAPKNAFLKTETFSKKQELYKSLFYDSVIMSLITVAYSTIGKLLINNKIAFNPSVWLCHAIFLLKSEGEGASNSKKASFRASPLAWQSHNDNKLYLLDSPYLPLYTKQENIKQILLNLFTAKVTETFAFSALSLTSYSTQKKTNFSEIEWKLSLERKLKLEGLNPNHIPGFGLWSLQGIDKTWRAANSIIFSYIEKQLLYKKSLVIPKLLQFYNAAIQSSALQDPPSAPSSFILLPAKRYENYKRSFLAMQNQKISYAGTGSSSSYDKIVWQSHEKRILKKKLYSLFAMQKRLNHEPNQKEISNKTKILNQNSSNPGKLNYDNMSVALLSVSQFIEKPTLINWYYRNRLLNRHRGYLNNQWWNGQLSEHNVETTFLSDVDWRSNFVSSFGAKSEGLQKKKNELNLLSPSGFQSEKVLNKKEKTQGLLLGSKKNSNLKSKVFENSKKIKHSLLLDILIDYPDFDQHYNPRSRRWILNFGYWSYWYDYPSANNKEIYYYMIIENFLQTYDFLNSNREILDYLVTKMIKSGLLKEINIIDSLKRF